MKHFRLYDSIVAGLNQHVSLYVCYGVLSDVADISRLCSRRQDPLPRDTNTTGTLWSFPGEMCILACT